MALLFGISLSGCANLPRTEPAVRPATLSDVTDPATRTLIRVHVRDVLGPGYMADIEALSHHGEMIARDNGRSQARGARIPLPDRLFRLEIAETENELICRLVPDQPDLDVLILPAGSGCDVHP
ncbi:MAG: hypothetical protein AAF926_02480 [Pseudomonadota bacterium]